MNRNLYVIAALTGLSLVVALLMGLALRLSGAGAPAEARPELSGMQNFLPDPATAPALTPIPMLPPAPAAVRSPGPPHTAPWEVPVWIDRPNGLRVAHLERGTGPGAKPGDIVVLDMVGFLPDGTQLVETTSHEAPLSMVLGKGEVLPGMDRALLGATSGETLAVSLPPELAYGAEGRPPLVPPDTTVRFDVFIRAVRPGSVAIEPEAGVASPP